MSRFDKIPTKLLLSIMFVLLTGIVFLAKIKKSPTTVSAWWNETWIYRNSIQITNNTSQESNVYTTLSIGTSIPIGTDKLQSDCGDLRFTDNSGNLLDYYLVSGCGTTATSINVNHVTFPAGQQTIYFYYGNSSADNGTQASNFSTEASNYSIGSTSSEETTPGPIAYWKFDEGVGSTAHDVTGSNNGTITGATWQTEDKCVSGKCLYFDGSSKVQIPSSDSFNSDTLTIQFWMNLKENDQWFAVYRPASGGNQWYIYHDNADYARLKWYNNSVVHNLWSLQAPNTNEWHQFTAVMSPNLQIMYSDGVEVYRTTIALSLTATDGDIKLGEYGSPGSYSLIGFLDEVKIYPYARTADQVKADYASDLAGMGSVEGSSVNIGGDSLGKTLSDSLVGYWTMDEGIGTTTLDKSDNNNTLTLTNAGWTNGKYGIGTSFDGTGDYLTMSNLDLANKEFTLSIWAKYSGTGYMAFFGQGPTSADSGLHIWHTGTFLRFGLYSNDVDATFTPDTNWHFYTFTITNENGYYRKRIYQDGINITDPGGSEDGGAYVGSGVFNLGRTYSAGAQYHNGQLDEARVYTRALSASEVQTLYNWAPGPVAHWKMDEGQGITTINDSSGNNQIGTILGSMTESDWSPGKYGPALTFDGTDDSISANDSPTLSPIYAITTEAWIYMDANPGDPDKDAYFGTVQKDGGYSGWGNYGFRIAGDKTINFMLAHGNLTGELSSLYSTTSLQINTWHHVAVTYNQPTSTRKIFINGVEDISSTAYSQILLDSPDVFRIASGDGRKFSGLIDDVKVYNYARTPRQILEDMNARSNTTTSTIPIAHWSFDEGYGTTANDSVGSNYNGTLSGTTIPEWTNNGKIGKALTFNGISSYVSHTTKTFSASQPWSFSMWQKTSATSWNGFIGSVLGNDGYWMWHGGNLTAYLESPTPVYFYNVVLGNQAPSNEWFHLAVVSEPVSSSAVNFHAYINGKLAETKNNVTLPNSEFTFQYVGRGDSRYFNGPLDEVKIYNYALSSDEVKQDYNQGKTTVLGSLSTNTGTTAPNTSDAARYCVPGDPTSCSSPIAEYTFDKIDTTYAYDTSGNGNDGTLGAGDSAPSYTPGKIGNALSFDGNNDYATISDSSTIDGFNSFTVEAWVYPNEIKLQTITMKPTTTGAGAIHNIELSSGGTIRGHIHNTDDVDIFNFYSSEYTAGEWQHITFTSIGTTAYMYRNGVLIGSQGSLSANTNLDNSTNPLYIGNNITSRYFNGQIDNIRIYNYARTPAQIAWDYNRGAPFVHWKFDKNQGITAYDSSINQINATIGTGGSTPTWTTGKLNSALSFDGDDRIQFPNNSIFKMGTSDYTISTWIKTSDSTCGIYRDSGSWYSGPWLEVYNSKIRAKLGKSDASISTSNAIKTLTDNTWHHAIVTYDRDGLMQTYIDGIPDAYADINSYVDEDINNTSSSKYIGSALSYCTGLIDDVRVYSYALTSDQIKTLYNNGAISFQ